DFGSFSFSIMVSQNNVARFEISVHNTFRVRVFEGLAHLNEDIERTSDIDVPLLRDKLPEIFSGNAVHHTERAAIRGDAASVSLHYIWMFQLLGALQFSL